MYDIEKAGNTGRVISFWSPIHRQGTVSTISAMMASYAANQISDQEKILLMSNELFGVFTAANYIVREVMTGGLLDVCELSGSENLKVVEEIRNNSYMYNKKLEILNSTKRNTNISDILPREIPNIFKVAKTGYSYIIVDCVAGVRDRTTISVLKSSDVVVVCLPQDRHVLSSWIRKLPGTYLDILDDNDVLYLSANHYEYPHMNYNMIAKELKQDLYFISMNDVVHRSVCERNIYQMVEANVKSKNPDSVIGELDGLFGGIRRKIAEIELAEVEVEREKEEKRREELQSYIAKNVPETANMVLDRTGEEVDETDYDKLGIYDDTDILRPEEDEDSVTDAEASDNNEELLQEINDDVFGDEYDVLPSSSIVIDDGSGSVEVPTEFDANKWGISPDLIKQQESEKEVAKNEEDLSPVYAEQPRIGDDGSKWTVTVEEFIAADEAERASEDKPEGVSIFAEVDVSNVDASAEHESEVAYTEHIELGNTQTSESEKNDEKELGNDSVIAETDFEKIQNDYTFDSDQIFSYPEIVSVNDDDIKREEDEDSEFIALVEDGNDQDDGGVDANEANELIAEDMADDEIVDEEELEKEFATEYVVNEKEYSEIESIELDGTDTDYLEEGYSVDVVERGVSEDENSDSKDVAGKDASGSIESVELNDVDHDYVNSEYETGDDSEESDAEEDDSENVEYNLVEVDVKITEDFDSENDEDAGEGIESDTVEDDQDYNNEEDGCEFGVGDNAEESEPGDVVGDQESHDDLEDSEEDSELDDYESDAEEADSDEGDDSDDEELDNKDGDLEEFEEDLESEDSESYDDSESEDGDDSEDSESDGAEDNESDDIEEDYEDDGDDYELDSEEDDTDDEDDTEDAESDDEDDYEDGDYESDCEDDSEDSESDDDADSNDEAEDCESGGEGDLEDAESNDEEEDSEDEDEDYESDDEEDGEYDEDDSDSDDSDDAAESVDGDELFDKLIGPKDAVVEEPKKSKGFFSFFRKNK